MKLQHQKILITGGSSGIGLELAKQLAEKGNSIVICARSADKLQEAKQLIPNVHTFQCDLSESTELNRLTEWLRGHHPDCNILINNAAIVHKTDFFSDPDMIRKARLEIQTNLLAPIELSKLFLQSRSNKQPLAIINITTGLVYSPRAVYPIYNATKAALHSFTQVLRKQLMDTPVKVIEVMMPVVNTPWHKGDVPKIAITPNDAVAEMISQIEKGQNEIRIGKVKMLYWLSRIAPALAFRIINRIQ